MTTLRQAATILAKRIKRETIRVIVNWDSPPPSPEEGVKVITWEAIDYDDFEQSERPSQKIE